MRILRRAGFRHFSTFDAEKVTRFLYFYLRLFTYYDA